MPAVCVTLAKPLYLCKPWFPRLCSREANSVYAKGFLWEINEMMLAKYVHQAWHIVSAQ